MKKIARGNEKGMLRITCPKCKIGFGLDTEFVEKMGEVNFHYACPYCRYGAKLK